MDEVPLTFDLPLTRTVNKKVSASQPPSSSAVVPAQPTLSASSAEPSQLDESLRSRSCAPTTAQANKSVPARVNPFTLAAKGKMTVEKREECHRKVTTFVVKRLHPFSEVEAPTFRNDWLAKDNNLALEDAYSYLAY
ncbi:hypothetical protein JOQ06_030029 [Pogonophryne albipinna]|uniref:Uncharacterized protein n=1 Tax=Pogonophryne albipinna TaxID=1090488 RepID=A0AAD6FFH0_9TELE|nr:hypothetical protein JOQ06_030029 [Pogonophryne albipinna]